MEDATTNIAAGAAAGGELGGGLVRTTAEIDFNGGFDDGGRFQWLWL